MENETQIKKLIEDWALAVRSKNIEGILAHHTADFIMYDVKDLRHWISGLPSA